MEPESRLIISSRGELHSNQVPQDYLPVGWRDATTLWLSKGANFFNMDINTGQLNLVFTANTTTTYDHQPGPGGQLAMNGQRGLIIWDGQERDRDKNLLFCWEYTTTL